MQHHAPAGELKVTDTCLYCQAPLELGDAGNTCDRCHRWRRLSAKCSGLLTEEQLHELAEYSRFIHTRPLTPQELELEEHSRLAREGKHAAKLRAAERRLARARRQLKRSIEAEHKSTARRTSHAY